jgi:uncharacterized small protein (DUF1192 family)
MGETVTVYEGPIETLTEAELAGLLGELSRRRAAARGELERLEAAIERLETELAGRGAGG